MPPPQAMSRGGRRHASHSEGMVGRVFDNVPRSDDMRGRSLHRARLPSSDQSYDSGTLGGNNNTQAASARTDSAIAVQSELQRAFINMNKALHPIIKEVLDAENEETPDWLKLCSQDNYFSLRSYASVDIPITRELWFTPVDANDISKDSWPGYGDSPGVNGGSDHGSIASRGSDRHMYGYGNF